ncbi:MAG: insulinase family protein [Candidatus Eremiobacteraeota bacterium]|nr:insulinase family protein [Candidatus Eremiobacteraeota bacterium]
MNRTSRFNAALLAPLAFGLFAAAPQRPPDGFPAAVQNTLANGVVVARQYAPGVPLVGVAVMVPAGLELQPSDEAGVAALTAAVVLHTPVDRGQSVWAAAAALGASVSYKLDPRDTRYYIEARPADAVRLLGDLAAALEHPDADQIPSQRAALGAAAAPLGNDPALTTFAMLRQVRYRGSGYALPEAGSALSLARVGAAEVRSFARLTRRGTGTVIALTGAASEAVGDAAGQAFSPVPAGSPPQWAAAQTPTRPQQVIVHGDVAAPWLALGYGAPASDAADYPAMLVVQALLSAGAARDALTFGSDKRLPDEYAGAFYQDDADPAMFVLFVNGQSGTVDQALRQIEGGIARLRTRKLDGGLIDRARRVALGRYYTSTATLEEGSGLLSRCAGSAAGVRCENQLAERISEVTPSDVRAVAQRYFINGTTALLLPVGSSPSQ